MSNYNIKLTALLKDNASSKLNRIGKNTDKLKSKFSSLTTTALRFGSMLGVAFGARKIIETTAEFEKMQAVLNNMYQDATVGAAAFQMLQSFAEKTPFSLQQITQSFIKLKARGIEPTTNELTKMGDFTSSMGKDMDQWIEAVLDAMTGENERLKEFGIKARKSGDQTAFTFKGVTTEVQNTEAAIKEYLISLGEMEGVSGTMDKVSATLGGRLSNLGDVFDKVSYTIGRQLLPVLTPMINGLIKFMNKLPGYIHLLKQYKEVIAGIAIAVGAIVAAQKLYVLWTKRAVIWQGLLALTNPYVLLAVGIGLVIAAIATLAMKMGGLAELWKFYTDYMDNVWVVFANKFAKTWNTYIGYPIEKSILDFKKSINDVAYAISGKEIFEGVDYQMRQLKKRRDDFNRQQDNLINSSSENLRKANEHLRNLFSKEAFNKDIANWKDIMDKYRKDLGIDTNVNTNLSTDTGMKLTKTQQVKAININIDRLVGVEQLTPNQFTNSEQNRVGEEMIKVLEKAVFDATNIL